MENSDFPDFVVGLVCVVVWFGCRFGLGFFVVCLVWVFLLLLLVFYSWVCVLGFGFICCWLVVGFVVGLVWGFGGGVSFIFWIEWFFRKRTGSILFPTILISVDCETHN